MRLQAEGSRFQLDGFVTLVDAKHIHFHVGRATAGGERRPTNALSRMFGKRREAWRQIAFADHIIVNKVCGERMVAVCSCLRC